MWDIEIPKNRAQRTELKEQSSENRAQNSELQKESSENRAHTTELNKELKSALEKLQEIKNDVKGKKMFTTYLLIALGGVLLGGGSTAAVMLKLMKSKDAPPVVVEQIAEQQIEVQKQLTQTDLLEIPCSAEFIADHNDLLCREMFCRMQQRGIDAQTSGAECESISNIQNSLMILKSCNVNEDKFDECSRIFNQRK